MALKITSELESEGTMHCSSRQAWIRGTLEKQAFFGAL